ncbi:MAG: type I methionyl aminopeptidase [Candidatus Gracilibacteria bacterium]|jgi:methionyl aminopeptidase|nr:type I methionyl aminopeptidase [Candidatus Gracilibacteria bacterium]
MKISIKTPEQIEIMRKGGKILYNILQKIKQETKAGMTTKDLDDVSMELFHLNNVRPSFLGYGGFPASVCVSVNDEIVHGIPGDRVLQNGDIVSVDCGVLYKGFHTDSCITYPVGGDNEISKETKHLLEITEKSLKNAISKCEDGVKLGDISYAIQKTVENEGLTIVRNLTGHGIGKNVHEPPQVLNYGKPNSGIRLQEGMTIAIEPIVVIGNEENYTLDDDWTIVSADGKLSAHFEHTVAITKKGAEILTI